MYERQLAIITKEHLMTHLATYLELFGGVAMPKRVEISSVIGGVIKPATLPIYALDCLTKQLSETNEDLNTFIYSGQITGLVGGRTPEIVDDQIKDHKAACEHFVTEHLSIATPSPDLENFLILAFAFASSDTTGALQVDVDPKTPFWVAGFDIQISWLVSEKAARQHA